MFNRAQLLCCGMSARLSGGSVSAGVSLPPSAHVCHLHHVTMCAQTRLCRGGGVQPTVVGAVDVAVHWMDFSMKCAMPHTA